MKKYIIASLICMLPFILIGVILPVLGIVASNGFVNFNKTALTIFLIIYCVSISIIITTLIAIFPYATKIDDLESAQRNVQEKEERLSKLIDHYNEQISKNDTSKHNQ